MAENAIFNNQTMAFMDTGMGLFLWQEMPASVTLTEGETYRVEWNDTECTCVAFAANFNGVDGIGIGDIALAGLGESTGEHFLFGTGADGSFSACYTDETNATNRMAIYHIAEDDKEYLIWGSTLKGIANAIRSKTGEAAEIAVADMADRISGITGGGSDVEVVYVTFMSHDGTTELYKRAVLPGNDCMEPVSGGLIDEPVRENTAAYSYTFGGWSTAVNGGLDDNALKCVTENRTVYAGYIVVVNLLASGDCGASAHWTLMGDGTLTLYGSGAVTKYTSSSLPPWQPYLSQITTLVIEEGITNVPQYCTHDGSASATNLTNVSLASTVTSIDMYGFKGCTGLTSIIIPDEVTMIDYQAFHSCSNLYTIVIGRGVTTIGTNAFSGTPNGKRVYVSDLAQVFGWSINAMGASPVYKCDLYLNGELLEHLIVPDGVTKIGQYSFTYCNSIKSISIPTSVKSVEKYAFGYCASLETVTIGSGVTYIGTYAFACNQLTTATFASESGWRVNDSDTSTSGTSIAVTDPATAATHLKTTYVGKRWHRV